MTCSARYHGSPGASQMKALISNSTNRPRKLKPYRKDRKLVQQVGSRNSLQSSGYSLTWKTSMAKGDRFRKTGKQP